MDLKIGRRLICKMDVYNNSFFARLSLSLSAVFFIVSLFYFGTPITGNVISVGEKISIKFIISFVIASFFAAMAYYILKIQFK